MLVLHLRQNKNYHMHLLNFLRFLLGKIRIQGNPVEQSIGFPDFWRFSKAYTAFYLRREYGPPRVNLLQKSYSNKYKVYIKALKHHQLATPLFLLRSYTPLLRGFACQGYRQRIA